MYLPQYPSGYLIIEAMAGVSQHVLFTHDLAKGELDCFSCNTGVSVLRLFTSMFTKESIQDPRFEEKINSSIGDI